MHVAICIVGFRNPDDVVRCLDHVACSSHRDFAVTIRENGGSDARAALAARLPITLAGGNRVGLLSEADNLGFAGGVNACIRATPAADAWWVLNPDTQTSPYALEALVERLSRGDVHAVGGTLHLPDGTVQGHGGIWRPWLARAVSIGHSDPLEKPVDPEAVERRLNYILGASMIVDRLFVERAGLMREDYFLYGEEVEWFLRARRASLALGFAPSARVLHAQGATTGSAAALRQRGRLPIYLDERNKLNIIRDTTPWLLPVAALCALVMGLGRFARRGAFMQQRHALSGWLAGLRGERGPPA